MDYRAMSLSHHLNSLNVTTDSTTKTINLVIPMLNLDLIYVVIAVVLGFMFILEKNMVWKLIGKYGFLLLILLAVYQAAIDYGSVPATISLFIDLWVARSS